MVDDKSVKQFFENNFITENKILSSQIVRMEILSFSRLTKEEEADINKLLAQCEIIGISKEIEDETISIRRKHKVKLPDAIIAASAIVTDSILVTKNIEDFRKINGLKLI